jgi:signal transduction histidine kinase
MMIEKRTGEKIIFSMDLDLTGQKESQRKDNILAEQSKMAAMGEMIGNIAHQWRQPLSIISTASTGMQIQKEFGALTDDILIQNCTIINDNVQYLSKTIDDFRNFIKGDRSKILFVLEDELNSFLSLINGSIKSHHITMVLDIQKDISLEGYPNELTQCLINIFNNAKDALVQNNEQNNRLVIISTTIKENNVVIQIKDNAGGIPNNIIKKVFEPYFTTKHQSPGTGLGLHMTYNLISEGMKGSVEVTNESYTYNKQQQKGAKFIITLPLS